MTKKKWCMVCVIGLLALITVFCILTFAPTFTSSANQPEISVRATTWNLHNGPVSIKPGGIESANTCYKDFGVYDDQYDVYEIGSLQAFKNFVTSVGNATAAPTKVGFSKFTNKTVKLTADIYCGDSQLHLNISGCITGYFHGVFDGQGHTIYNLQANFEDSTNRYAASGMFGMLYGTVKNTRFCGHKVSIGGVSSSYNGVHAVIAAKNYGTIENCIVEDCTFISSRHNDNCSVAPIAAENSGTVKNCIVKGSYTIGGKNENLLSKSDGLKASHFVVSVNEAQNCIFYATIKKTQVTDQLIVPSDNDKNAFDSAFGNSNSYTGAYTSFSSSIANSSASGTTPWYKYTTTSTGAYRGYGGSSSVPIYLRAFIKWETYYFSVAKINEVSPGTVSTSSVTVPSDYKTVGTTNNTKTVYGITITATAYNNYEFVSWTSSTSTVNGKTITTYTASFRMSDFDVSFADDDSSEYGNSGMGKISYRYGSNSFTTVTTVSFKVSQGSSVQISFLTSHSECSYPTSGTKYAVVKMTFTGKRMISGSPESTARNYEVLFVLTSGDYYISSAKVTKSAEYAYTTNQSITIDRATSFTVRYAVRDYGLEIV